MMTYFQPICCPLNDFLSEIKNGKFRRMIWRKFLQEFLFRINLYLETQNIEMVFSKTN